MAMNDFDIEITDIKDSTPQHFNGTVTTAGTPVSITPSNGRIIQLALIKNPSKGTNKNNTADVLLLNIDATTTYMSLNRGEFVYLAGAFATLKIDSNNNGVKYEVVVWS
jgi:hypothetical protein